MTLSPVRLALASLLICVLLPGGRGGARAEDPSPTTAAEQAFKDAWWAETGGGNLNEALALYEKAAAAEGPAPVRAKALYRRAIVLQRIGRTEEAIKTLERLAKEHPGETSLQSDARARLEEWTAIDLRTGFPEWYRRFQYGPEFQAKVLDLVLRLGSSDHQVQRNAESEILTIGEPTVGALRAHLASHNEMLRKKAMDLLLKLGVVPDEVVTQRTWMDDIAAWGRIMDLPAKRREDLRAHLGPDGEAPSTPALRATLGGPEAALTWIRTTPTTEQAGGRRGWVLAALVNRIPKDGTLFEAARDLARERLADGQPWHHLIEWYMANGLATRDDLHRLERGQPGVNDSLLVRMALDERIVAPREGLSLVLRVAERVDSAWGGPWSALVALLPRLPWPESKADAVRLLSITWPKAVHQNEASLAPSARLAEVFEAAVELQESDEIVLNALLRGWDKVHPDPAAELLTIVRWIREGPSKALRSAAVQRLDGHGRPVDAQILLSILTQPDVPHSERATRWSKAFQSRLGAVLWATPAAISSLLAHAQAIEAVDARGARDLTMSLLSSLTDASRVLGIVSAWLRHPAHTPEALFTIHIGPSIPQRLMASGDADVVRKQFRERWLQASAEERRGLLLGRGWLVDDKGQLGSEMQAFWRQRLQARPMEVPKDARSDLLKQLGPLSVEDLRAAFELGEQDEADRAATYVFDGRLAPLGVPAAREVFEALRIALRPDGPNAELLGRRLRASPDLDADLLPLLIASQSSGARGVALDILHDRSTPADQELWGRALRDDDPDLRQRAARGVSRVPTTATQKALVAALDDPHPDVRAAALASLNGMEKMEELKARWREKVK